MKRLHVALAFALGIAVLCGAGCSKAKNVAVKESSKPSVPQQVQTSTAKPAPAVKPADPKATVLAAMENFRNVKSYRAKFTLPTSKGALTGDLSYVQPDRFQAAMIVPGASETDIIIVAHSVYLRLGSSAWNDISSNVAARNSAIAMLAAARGDTAFSADQSDKLQILSVDTNATQGCDLFSIQSKDAKPDAKPIALCIKDGYPKYFETATASGTVHVDYYDYAALFVIARPM